MNRPKNTKTYNLSTVNQHGEGLASSVVEKFAPVLGRLAVKFIEQTLEEPVAKLGRKLGKKISGNGNKISGNGNKTTGYYRSGSGNRPTGYYRGKGISKK